MDSLLIQSHQGHYPVYFNHHDLEFNLNEETLSHSHFIMDANVAGLHSTALASILKAPSVLLIAANEKNKSLNQFPIYVEHLVKHGLRKNHRLIAIGGGVIQDITSFLAATLLRGIQWYFYPTTLLAQADSCIGGKSSVNCGSLKNILGTFTPPQSISIHTQFLQTLAPVDIHSGIGEIIKIHALDGMASFEALAKVQVSLAEDIPLLSRYVRQALRLKQAIIEADEFDQGIRNLLNYGHTFGHALETATAYQIPHGIAITIGMDMANFVAYRLGLGREDFYLKMHPVLKRNYQVCRQVPVDREAFFLALSSDKKNRDHQLGLLLPNQQNKVVLTYVEKNQVFHEATTEYLNNCK